MTLNHMIMPLMTVCKQPTGACNSRFRSYLYSFRQFSVICVVTQRDEDRSGRFAEVATHKCRRYYTNITMPEDDLNRKRRFIQKSENCEIPNCNSSPQFTVSFPLFSSLHMKCECFGAILIGLHICPEAMTTNGDTSNRKLKFFQNRKQLCNPFKQT